MTRDVQRPGLLAGLGRFLLAPSEIAVAIHFHAPWLPAEPVLVRAGRSVSRPGMGAACTAC